VVCGKPQGKNIMASLLHRAATTKLITMASREIVIHANFRQNILMKNIEKNYAKSEYKHVLTNISSSRYVAIAMQPVHRLQIRPIVHNYGHPYHSPKLHPGPCNSVGMRPPTDRQTRRQTMASRRQTHRRA